MFSSREDGGGLDAGHATAAGLGLAGGGALSAGLGLKKVKRVFCPVGLGAGLTMLKGREVSLGLGLLLLGYC